MTALRCWPGCLAEIVHDHDFPQNVGIRVVVVWRAEEAVFGELWGEDWAIRPSHPIWAWDDDERTTASQSLPGEHVAFHDAWLRPILPPPGTTTTEDRAPIEGEIVGV